MLKIRCLVFLVGMVFTILGTLPVQAQLECTDPDLLAVVFPNDDINYSPPIATPYEIKVVLLNPTDQVGFDAFEFSLVLPPSIFVLNTVIPPNSVNIGSGTEFIVGVAQCVQPVNERFELVTLTLMNIDDVEVDVFLQPTSVQSIPGQMAYQGCSNTGLLLPMHPLSGDFSLPVARMNPQVPLEYCDPPSGLDMIVGLEFGRDADNRAATSLGATDGFDIDYDLIDGDATLTFPHFEWGNPEGNIYKQDVMAAYDPTLEMKMWSFVTTATTSQSGGEMVDVFFTPNFPTPAPFDFKVLDRASGSVTDLNTTLSYSYYIGPGTDSRTFDLMIGNDNTGPSGFYVDVNAVSGEYSDLGNRLGTDLVATDGYDPGLDIPEPGPPPANYLIAYYNQGSWPLGPRFSSDIREVYDPTLGARGSWPLVVDTDQSGPVTLSFSPSFTEADNYGLYLQDLQSGQTYNLFPGLNYVFQADGINLYEFRITVGASSPPELDPTSRFLEPGWSMIGMPLMPYPGEESWNSVILDQAPGFGYLFEYLGLDGYRLIDGMESGWVGQGYWFATDTGFDWTMNGDPTLVPTAIPMNEGWNFIGNPLWFPAPFEGMRIQDGGAEYTWLDAVNLGLVSTGVLGYDNSLGDYIDAIDLRPWNGYWVNALKPGLVLWFDWPNFQVLPARFTARKGELSVPGFAWETEITMQDVNDNRKSIVMGVHPEATVGFDPRFDMPQPPSSPDGVSRFAFIRPEWDLAAGDFFTRDVMLQSKDSMVWNAVVKAGSPGTVTLSWNGSGWPEGVDFQIYLPQENRVVVMSMRNQRKIQLEVGSRAVPIVIRTPDLTSSVEDMPGMNYEVGVHPNPFNPMTTIHFDLPRPANAEIRIYSVRGELLKVLGGQQYQAGRQEVVWQGRDRSGQNAPSGSYFARLYVDGHPMGTVTKMSLVR